MLNVKYIGQYMKHEHLLQCGMCDLRFTDPHLFSLHRCPSLSTTPPTKTRPTDMAHQTLENPNRQHDLEDAFSVTAMLSGKDSPTNELQMGMRLPLVSSPSNARPPLLQSLENERHREDSSPETDVSASTSDPELRLLLQEKEERYRLLQERASILRRIFQSKDVDVMRKSCSSKTKHTTSSKSWTTDCPHTLTKSMLTDGDTGYLWPTIDHGKGYLMSAEDSSETLCPADESINRSDIKNGLDDKMSEIDKAENTFGTLKNAENVSLNSHQQVMREMFDSEKDFDCDSDKENTDPIVKRTTGLSRSMDITLQGQDVNSSNTKSICIVDQVKSGKSGNVNNCVDDGINCNKKNNCFIHSEVSSNSTNELSMDHESDNCESSSTEIYSGLKIQYYNNNSVGPCLPKVSFTIHGAKECDADTEDETMIDTSSDEDFPDDDDMLLRYDCPITLCPATFNDEAEFHYHMNLHILQLAELSKTVQV